MAITFQADKINFPKIRKGNIKNWIKRVAASYGKTIGEVNYLFCTDDKILEVNTQYLSHDFYTDIITFDYSEGDKISGDIIISLETVRTNSQKYSTDFTEELHRVIIHGILHMCGIDDKSETASLNMRKAENQALEQINPQ
ncbi:MAG: Endoribonuclease YbeY [Petrimonas sp.]|jgi:probable rRNA maturation factor|uniref:rRNA maturation RNase YbeY n=1 Tax=Petrimonas sp. TaxID=2023866 RepID=UPI0030D25141